MMFFHVQRLINEIVPDEPDPAAANVLQEGLGGQFGEMRTMMQYLFQSFNSRGDATPYKDLIQGVGIEEISHVELITTTINNLLDGASAHRVKQKKGRGETPAAGGGTPLSTAPMAPNPHHFIVAPQCALPVDAAGNPWLGSYVYASGNLTLDLLYNLMLESTGRLQKCRIYEMSDNKTLRETVAYLIVRDHNHEMVFAKALEALGVNWGKILPIPNFDAEAWPEVRRHMESGLHLRQHHWRLDGSQMGAIFNGSSPANDGTTVETQQEPPEGAPIPLLPERPEEFAPGLTPELADLIDAMKSLDRTVVGVPGDGAPRKTAAGRQIKAKPAAKTRRR